MKNKTRFITQSALFAALMCVLCPLAIPAGPIPFTLGTFSVLLAAQILPWRGALCAVVLYILIGLVGLPVFSGAQSGFGALLGPTGGYLWCYIPMAVIAGQGRGSLLRGFACGCMALLLCYLCGSWQFTLVSGSGWIAALSACVFPFLPFDVLKLACACVFGSRIRRRLEAAELL